MSRVGQMPINVPDGVKVSIKENHVKVEGPKGMLERTLRPEMTIKQDGSMSYQTIYQAFEFNTAVSMEMSLKAILPNANDQQIAEIVTLFDGGLVAEVEELKDLIDYMEEHESIALRFAKQRIDELEKEIEKLKPEKENEKNNSNRLPSVQEGQD